MWKKLKKKFFKEQQPTVDYIIIGLGNPGEKYYDTVHNVGFRIISSIREDSDFPAFTKDNTISAVVSEGVIGDKKIALVAPLTFMNLSGETARRALRKYHAPSTHLVVIHDDADICAGEAKISTNRGSAGHKGVASIIKCTGSKDFIRIRVGFDKHSKKAVNVVLKKADKRTLQTEKVVTEEFSSLISSGFATTTLSTGNNKKTP